MKRCINVQKKKTLTTIILSLIATVTFIYALCSITILLQKY